MKKLVAIIKQNKWDFLFGFSYVLLPFIFLIADRLNNSDHGSAIGGKIEKYKYYVVDEFGKYYQVDGVTWIINLVFSVIFILIPLIGIIGFVYFFIKYILIPMFAKKGL